MLRRTNDLECWYNWSWVIITNYINMSSQRTHNTHNLLLFTNYCLVWQAITFWVFKEVMIIRSQRHQTEEELEGYRLHSRLTIKQVNPGDYGAYKCVSKNSLGETEGQIRLYGEFCVVSLLLFCVAVIIRTYGRIECCKYAYEVCRSPPTTIVVT